MPKKRRKKPLLRRLELQADKVFSLYIRAKTALEFDGKCPLCLDGVARPIDCNFHFIRRGRKIVRWEEINTIGSCDRDNYLEYRNPDPYRAWFIRRYGVDKYLELADKSIKVFKPTEEYLRSVIDRYERKLNDLPKASDTNSQ